MLSRNVRAAFRASLSLSEVWGCNALLPGHRRSALATASFSAVL